MVQMPRYARIFVLACLAAVAGCAAPTLEIPVAPEAATRTLPEAPAERQAAILTMADRAMAAGDGETAARLYSEAIRQGGEDPGLLDRLARAYLTAARWSEAAGVYRRILLGQPADIRAQRGYARALMRLGQPAAAVGYLEDVARAAPDAATLNALGVAYDMLGRHADARAAYERGLAIAPDDRSLRNNLGLSQALAGDHEAAIRTLEPLAVGPASTAQARQNLALAYGLKGDALAAERVGLLDLDPDSVRSNQAFFMALRGMAEPGSAASALVVDPSPQPKVAPGIEIVRSRLRPAEPAETAAGAPPRRRGEPMPLGGGADSLALGRDLPTTPAAIALDSAEMASGLAPIGSWLLDLGSYPSPGASAAAWRSLRRDSADLLGGMTRLAGAGGGRQPLLVGPIASEAEADRLCRELGRRGTACSKLKI
jgi:Flp pilus assembly protein TadD